MLGMNRLSTDAGDTNTPERVLGLRISALHSVINAILTALRVRELRLHGKIGIFILGFFTLMAIFGPALAPYDPRASLFDSEGRLKSLEPPSLSHPLGTTWQGRDVLSQVLHGCRPTLFVGATAAFVCSVRDHRVVWVGTHVAAVPRPWVDVPRPKRRTSPKRTQRNSTKP